MVRILLLVLFFTVTGNIHSQENTIVLKLDGFSRVKAFDGLSINLVRSNENKAIVSGANTDKISMVNTDGELKIRMQVTKIFSGFKTFVELHYTNELLVIDVNEDAKVTSKDTLVQDVIELKAQEGGEVSIKADVEQMLIKSVTGGVITASGKSDVQDVAINTGGVYNGKDFITKFSTVNVNAGSKAEIYASDYVKATVKAGGEVIVHGNPAKMDEKTVFGGVVRRI